MATEKVIAPELLAEAKRLYEETDTPVQVIAKRVGIARKYLRHGR